MNRSIQALFYHIRRISLGFLIIILFDSCLWMFELVIGMITFPKDNDRGVFEDDLFPKRGKISHFVFMYFNLGLRISSSLLADRSHTFVCLSQSESSRRGGGRMHDVTKICLIEYYPSDLSAFLPHTFSLSNIAR